MGWLKSYLPVMAMLFNQSIYAGISLSTRVAFLQGMSPRVFVVYRHAFATIVIAPIAYFSGITLNQNLFFEGLYLASSSVASAMANLVPAVTFIIAACAGMEKVNIRSTRSLAKIIGTVICVSGAVSMALLKGPKLLNAEILPSKSIMASGGDHWLLGCLFLTGCCCAWSVWLILMANFFSFHPDHLSFSAWMCFMATLQSTLVTLLLEPDPHAWKINSLLEFGCTLYSGVIGSAVLLFIQAWCISLRGPLFCAMFNPLFTVIVTILAALLLHEEIYSGSLIGSTGVIIGLYVVHWGKAEKVSEVNVKLTDPKSMVNSTEDVKILINGSSSVKACCKTNNLEEPLLSADSPSHR
ncbi:Auxin-induced protein 5NG4 [Glycine soja]|uniref:WAT1-related protein n=1 Tax=Glycine soja TaxID=3848 RepID=A0A0B2P2P4_GLYSO|nr:Auxin-induced protein 5NG4 [Glycine soja]